MPYTMRNNNQLFEIVEKSSELIVAIRKTKEDAVKLTRSLNLGSGFDGFTPQFFTLAYPNPDDPLKANTVQT